jgi:spermidine/putrescine transport system permease protein
MQRTLRRFPSLGAWLLLSPAIFWLIFFFVAPLFIVVIYGFDRGTYGGVIWNFNLKFPEGIRSTIF